MKENKALKIFIAVIVLSFVVHQVYSSLYSPVTTQNAEFFTATDGINAQATIIRQEKIITSAKSGTLHFSVEDGTRVSKGGTVADIYNSPSASITVSKIDELNKKIHDIEEISNYNDVAAADLELVNSKIQNALSGYVFNSSGGELNKTDEDLRELSSAINRKTAITGESADFSQKLAELNGELSKLNAELSAPVGSIKSNESGYFVSAIDGYENLLTSNNISEITPEYLEKIKPEKTPENAIGKIVSDYDWYIAATVSLNDSLRYKEGDELTVRTTIRNTPTLKVTVKRINVSNEKDSATVIFSSQEMNRDLATMRTGNITIVSNEYNGLKIPKKALRVVDGKTGVYIVSGITVKYVKVNVLFSTDDYVLCEQKTENSSDILRLYDEVIVRGKNLYDGKTIG